MVPGESGEVGNSASLGMTKERVGDQGEGVSTPDNSLFFGAGKGTADLYTMPRSLEKHIQERSAELQIPRLPRISCRELRLRSTACGSL